MNDYRAMMTCRESQIPSPIHGNQPLLDIGSGSHFGGAAHQNANCTAANFSEKFRLAGIGVRFMDEGNFCFGDSAFDQLCFHVIVDIENARLGRRQIAENKLRTALRHTLGSRAHRPRW